MVFPAHVVRVAVVEVGRADAARERATAELRTFNHRRAEQREVAAVVDVAPVREGADAVDRVTAHGAYDVVLALWTELPWHISPSGLAAAEALLARTRRDGADVHLWSVTQADPDPGATTATPGEDAARAQRSLRAVARQLALEPRYYTPDDLAYAVPTALERRVERWLEG